MILSAWDDPSLLRSVTPDVSLTVTEFSSTAKIVLPKKSCVLFRVGSLPHDEMLAFQRALANTFMGNQTPAVLCIDEAHVLLRYGLVHRELVRLIRGSRHYGCSVYIATQRLVDVIPDVRAVVTDMFIFRTTSFRDLDLLGQEGIPSDPLRSLSVGKYVYVNRLSGEVCLP